MNEPVRGRLIVSFKSWLESLRKKFLIAVVDVSLKMLPIGPFLISPFSRSFTRTFKTKLESENNLFST